MGIHLVGALLVEMNDEMIAADRRYIAEASVATLLSETVQGLGYSRQGGPPFLSSFFASRTMILYSHSDASV